MKLADWFPSGTYSLVSKRLSERTGELLWAWREAPKRADDSGWRFLSLHDTQQALNHEAPLYLDQEDVLILEPAIKQIFGYPVGSDLQMARGQEGKFFVYNDTYQEVTPAPQMAALPYDEAAFKDHFPQLARQLEQYHQRMSYHIDHEELDYLNQATQRVEQLIHILLGTRTDEMTNDELYLLLGIALGFQTALHQEYPDLTATRLTNFLLAYLNQHFALSLDLGWQWVQTYQEQVIAPAVTQQLQDYGRAFYRWLKAGHFEQVNTEYRQICAYYLQSPDA